MKRRRRPTLADMRTLGRANAYAERELGNIRAELAEAKRLWAASEERLREAQLALARVRAPAEDGHWCWRVASDNEYMFTNAEFDGKDA